MSDESRIIYNMHPSKPDALEQLYHVILSGLWFPLGVAAIRSAEMVEVAPKSKTA